MTDNLPTAIQPRPDLGVPDPEDLLAHFLAEHGGDVAFSDEDDGTGALWVGFGGVDACPVWPSDDELAAARSRIGERR